MRIGALLVLVVALTACGGAKKAAAPSAASACGTLPAGLDARASWLETSDGVRLYAVAAGSGRTTVVLAHESPADLCGWLPTMRWLAANGIATLAFDFRGFGRSTSPPMPRYLRYAPDLQAAVDAARDDGASRVVVMGASFGGAAALANGPALHGVAAFVSLSGEQRLAARRLDAIGAVPKLHVPLLVVASRDDRHLDAADARALVSRAGSSRKRAAIFPGAFHGWDLLDDAPYRARVRRLVLAWIR